MKYRMFNRMFMFILISMLNLNNNAHASIFELSPQKMIIGAGLSLAIGTAISTVVTTIVTGRNLDKSINIVNKTAKTKIGREFFEDFLLTMTLKTRYSSHPKRAFNTMAIAQGSVIYTPAYEQRVEKTFTEYDKAVAMLTLRADRIKRQNSCLGRYRIYIKGMVLKPEKGVKDVKEWDYGSFLYLENIAPPKDGFEHDHIPSIQAIFTYLEKRDVRMYGKLKRDDGYAGESVMNNATAIEVKRSLHQQGRTWFWKQGQKVKDTTTNALKKLYEADAEDLYQATILDFTAYVIIQKGLTPLMEEAFDATIERNTKLCLYE